MKATAENFALIDLANALSREHTVFLCNAQPYFLDERAGRADGRAADSARRNPRPDFLDGRARPRAAGGTRDQGRRAALLGELFRILRIDVLHSHSLLADRLVLAPTASREYPGSFIRRPMVPRFLPRALTTPTRRIASTILNEARGFFLDDRSPARRDARTKQRPVCSRSQSLDSWIPGKPVDQIAATLHGGYTSEVCNLLAFPRPADAMYPRRRHPRRFAPVAA